MTPNVGFRTFVILVCLGLIVYYVLRQVGVFHSRRGTGKTKVEVQAQKKTAQRRRIVLWVCTLADKVERNFGFPTSRSTLAGYERYISRLHLAPPLLGRHLTPEELAGLVKLLQVLLVGLGLFLGILVSKIFFILAILGLFSRMILGFILQMIVESWDAEIEKDFPRFFELMYSRLLRGSNTRLAISLDEYLRSMNELYGVNEHQPMRRFVNDFRMAIELYGDDSLAIRNLRLSYSSATVVNFFNVALQALRGADSRDKLLSLKLELTRRQVESMEREAEKRKERGQRLCMLLYVILFQFIILTWLSKLGIL